MNLQLYVEYPLKDQPLSAIFSLWSKSAISKINVRCQVDIDNLQKIIYDQFAQVLLRTAQFAQGWTV